jgi:transposase-like protein
MPLLKKYVDSSAQVWSDYGSGYSKVSATHEHHAVNHSSEYCTDDGINNNQAESYHSRMRRAEYGVYNGMRQQYFKYYANEFAWRSDMSATKKTQWEKFHDLMQRIFRCGPLKA